MNKLSKEIIEKNNNSLAKQLYNYFSIFVFCYKIDKEDLDLTFLINCNLYCNENQVLLVFFTTSLKKKAENIFQENNLKPILLEKIFFNFDDVLIDCSEVEDKNNYFLLKKKILTALDDSEVKISYQN